MRRAWMVLAVALAACTPTSIGPETTTTSTPTTVAVAQPTSTQESPAPASPGITIPDLLGQIPTPPTTPNVIGAAPVSPTTPGAVASPVVVIEGCAPYGGVLWSLLCTDRTAYQACLTELWAGTVGDCRGVFDHEFNPAFSPVYEDVTPGTQVSFQSSMAIEVFSGDRGGGSSSGEAMAQLDFAPPDPPPATQCEPGCPEEVCGVDYCSRSCHSAQGWNTSLHTSTAGIPALSALGGDSCASGISAASDLSDETHLVRAWEACRRGNHWGGSTQITVAYELGKVFLLRNPTVTSSVEENGDSTTVTWSFENPAQPWLRYVVVDFPVEVTCRLSRSG